MGWFSELNLLKKKHLLGNFSAGLVPWFNLLWGGRKLKRREMGQGDAFVRLLWLSYQVIYPRRIKEQTCTARHQWQWAEKISQGCRGGCVEIVSTQKALESCLIKKAWRKGANMLLSKSTSKFVYKPLFNLVQAGVSIFAYFSILSVILVKVLTKCWSAYL